MARIFISHSSQNSDQAKQLRDWLVANGWDDVFLDLDPERGIAAGERWKEALQKAAQQCEAVLALISPEWLASDWCRPELNTAQLLGKKIIVLLIGSKPADVPGDLKDAQYVDLINDPDAYTRLKEGLKRAGLDPASFAFEEGRRPYPGFAPLEEDDAAIFFGREAQIVRGLDKLRGLARTGVERMLIVLGASGCGKSSFLRAGLWPRLKRDDSTWLPLPTIRPERAVISGKFGLVEALYHVMNEAPFAEKLQKQELPRSRADIEAFVTTRDDGLLKILAALREAGQVPGLSGEETQPPTIVIPIDQGEELFNEDGRAEAKRFIDILTKTLAADPRVLALFTMRTDSFPQFQNDPALAAVPKDTFTLDMMLEGSYREVIEGPAALVKPKPLKIDPQLTDALLQDAAGQDALALLAFTLRYLYDKYQANNELSLEGYEKLGRLKGVIETTVKQALADGVAKGELPKDDKAQLALIRKAFIPHLARVNAAGQFVRRIAARAEIPTEARPLIDRLTEARLLIKDRRTVGGEDVEVIEVAHEALLREWKDLHEALLEEREFLIAKGQLEQDVAEWQATPDVRKRGALLRDNKLARAHQWLIERPQDLAVEERQFIQASADAEVARRRWGMRVVAVAFIVVASAAAVMAGLWLETREAKIQAEAARDRFRQALEKIAANIAAANSNRLRALEERVSPEAVDAMVQFEGGDVAYYKRRLEQPTWPGGRSGVVIGIDYDLGYVSVQRFTDDWEQYFVDSDFERLKSAVGKTGEEAKNLASSLSDILIPYKAALTVMKISTMSQWLAKLDRELPGAEKLPPQCTGALLSLLINRGSFQLSGPRYQEMRNIHDFVARGEFAKIPDELRAMKRLWPGLPGIAKRRETEAALCENALKK